MTGDSDQPRQLSLWALASLLCSICFMCPIASLLGPLLGVRAIVQIRGNPQRTGMRLAVAGIVIGVLATAGWGAVARWWHVNARMPMISGPAAELRSGLRGDLEAFRAGFAADGADDAEVAAFLDEVRGRYGRFIRSAQRRPSDPGDQAGAADGDWTQGRARIPYTFRFEAGAVDAEAEFVVMADGPRPLLKFAWFALRDDEQGDLVYPASAAEVAARHQPLPENN